MPINENAFDLLFSVPAIIGSTCQEQQKNESL